MSLARRAIKIADIQRAEIAHGRRQNPLPHLSGLKCTPLYPADAGRLAQLVESGTIESLVNVYETFVLGNHDIRPGDVLTVDDVRYVVRGAAAWGKPATAGAYYMHLTVEKILQ